MTTNFAASRSFTDLSQRLAGAVFTPDHPGYEAACRPWNLAFTHRPAAVVTAASVSDVVQTVRHAGRLDLSVAVQATGHGVTVPADESAVLVVLSGLDHVQIDASTARAKLGGGVTWAPVLAEAQKDGLAPLLGSSPYVGAVGYTLGGGFGWLGRRHGLSVDHVRSFTVVLADGQVVHASADSHAELFWALRGGGAGSLGVVVEMEVDLVPVTTVYGGNLFYPIESAREVFDFYMPWSASLPDEMTTAFNITSFPPIDIVPEPLRGRAFAIVRGCHCGDLAEAQTLVDAWRRWRAPQIDAFGPMPFRDAATISQDPVDPVPAVSSGRWLTGLDSGVLDAMIDTVVGGDHPSPMLFAETRHAGGAIATPVPGASFAARGADRMLEVVGLVPDREAHAEAERRAGGLWRRLAPNLAELSGYLNFAEGDDRQRQVSHAFDAVTLGRLADVKRTVDPGGRFGHGLDLALHP